MFEKHLALYRSLKRNKVKYLIIGFGTAHLTTPEKIIANEINIFEDFIRLDILIKVKGLVFNIAWQRRQVKSLKAVKINVVSLYVQNVVPCG